MAPAYLDNLSAFPADRASDRPLRPACQQLMFVMSGPYRLFVTAVLLIGVGCGGSAEVSGLPLDHPLVAGSTQERGDWIHDANIESSLIVQECMLESGFEYQPSRLRFPLLGFRSRPGYLGEPTESDGYQLASKYLAVPDSELLAFAEELMQEQSSSIGTGNQAVAYTTALVGDPEAGTTGCDKQGAAATRAIDEELDLLYQVVVERRSRIDADERTIELNSAWASCMASRGFGDFDKPSDPYVLIEHRIGAIQEGSLDYSSETALEARRLELEAIYDDEVRIANADFLCRAEEDAELRRAIETEYYEAVDPGLVSLYVHP